VVTAAGDDLTATDDHFRTAMGQVAGAFAQLEKARLVAKLKSARLRKSAAGERDGGRWSYAEKYPTAVALAKKLRRYQKLSLAEITAALAAAGHVTSAGRPIAVHKMIR
jgi:hypothetical protein